MAGCRPFSFYALMSAVKEPLARRARLILHQWLLCGGAPAECLQLRYILQFPVIAVLRHFVAGRNTSLQVACFGWSGWRVCLHDRWRVSLEYSFFLNNSLPALHASIVLLKKNRTKVRTNSVDNSVDSSVNRT